MTGFSSWCCNQSLYFSEKQNQRDNVLTHQLCWLTHPYEWPHIWLFFLKNIFQHFMREGSRLVTVVINNWHFEDYKKKVELGGVTTCKMTVLQDMKCGVRRHAMFIYLFIYLHLQPFCCVNWWFLVRISSCHTSQAYPEHSASSTFGSAHTRQ